MVGLQATEEAAGKVEGLFWDLEETLAYLQFGIGG